MRKTSNLWNGIQMKIFYSVQVMTILSNVGNTVKKSMIGSVILPWMDIWAPYGKSILINRVTSCALAQRTKNGAFGKSKVQILKTKESYQIVTWEAFTRFPGHNLETNKHLQNSSRPEAPIIEFVFSKLASNLYTNKTILTTTFWRSKTWPT